MFYARSMWRVLPIESFDELASSDRTVVMTGHDSRWLRRYCPTALWLDGGRLRMHGPADEVLDAYDRSFAP